MMMVVYLSFTETNKAPCHIPTQVQTWRPRRRPLPLPCRLLQATLNWWRSTRARPACAPVLLENPRKKHTLYLGRNISDGSKVDDQMWRTFQRDTVNRLTTCSTTLDAEGCWYREIEETKIISVIVEDGSLDAAEQYDGLQRVGEEWKRRFRQEAVYLENHASLRFCPLPSFIVLTETKFSFRCIPVWDRYSPHRTRVEKKKHM